MESNFLEVIKTHNKSKKVSSNASAFREFVGIFLIFLIATVQNINGMWNIRKQDGVYKTFEFIHTQIYVCRYKVNQHLIVLSLFRVSVNKILVTELIIVKVSELEFDVKYINTMKSTT